MNVTVQGNATSEEIAAVLAVVARAEQARADDSYQRWRRARLDALRNVAFPLRVGQISRRN